MAEGLLVAHGIGWGVAGGTWYWLKGCLWHTVLAEGLLVAHGIGCPNSFAVPTFYLRHCKVHGLGNMSLQSLLYSSGRCILGSKVAEKVTKFHLLSLM